MNITNLLKLKILKLNFFFENKKTRFLEGLVLVLTSVQTKEQTADTLKQLTSEACTVKHFTTANKFVPQ
jgi:hypothetical protein